MPIQVVNHLKFFYFENLRDAGLPHGIFSRQGGVSPNPWGTLNTGSMVGDEISRVAENVTRAASALGRPKDTLIGVRQVHGKHVYCVDQLPKENSLRKQVSPFDSPEAVHVPEADAIVTQNPDLTLFMRFADCVPIILYDPVNQVVGIAHAGWRGTVLKIVQAAVEKMHQRYHSKAGDILAGIGPSICADHYEVGQEVADAAAKAFGTGTSQVLKKSGPQYWFDLWHANRIALEEMGVTEIEISDSCTIEEPDLWFSHRGEQGRTGRFVAMVGMNAHEHEY